MSDKSVGIIGGGMVGGAVKSFFKQAKVYDKYKKFETIEDVGRAKFIFICVPTPTNDSGIDLSIVDEAVAHVANHLTNPEEQLVVIKSTVLPGTTQSFQDKYPAINFAFNPEFLRDKHAAEDFVKNDRQIVGYTSKTKNSHLITELSEILPKAAYQKKVPAEVAEMVKYAGNTFLALKVIFANQIYDISQAAGANYENVKEAVISDQRIGESHWRIFHTESSLSQNQSESYRGYGGKCFPKDINSLIFEGKKLGVDMSLFEAARAVNQDLNGGKYDQ